MRTVEARLRRIESRVAELAEAHAEAAFWKSDAGQREVAELSARMDIVTGAFEVGPDGIVRAIGREDDPADGFGFEQWVESRWGGVPPAEAHERLIELKHKQPRDAAEVTA